MPGFIDDILGGIGSVTDSIGGLFDEGEFLGRGGFLSRNKPLIDLGIGLYGRSQSSNIASRYLDFLRQREDENYRNYLTQVEQENQQRAANQAAAQQANEILQQAYAKQAELFSPYAEAGARLIPRQERSYRKKLKTQNSLLKFLTSPEQLAKLSGSVPAYNVDVPLPDYVRVR